MTFPRPLVAVAALAAVSSLACGGAGAPPAEYHVPLLSELSPDADATLDVVDRAAELAGAIDADAAPEGAAPDLAAPPDGFRMVFDSRGMDSTAGIEGGTYQEPAGPTTQFNIAEATLLVAQADATTALLVGVPAAAVDIVLHGQTTQIGPNVWASTNTVSDGVTSVTGLWVVAWVNVGWVAEMRLWSSDGTYDDTKWFNGFLSADQQAGWWDFYDGYGTMTGVIEWASDGQGTGELGLASTAGDTSGQALGYLFTPDTGFVGLHDPAAGDAYVTAFADHSGELQYWGYNSGAVSCWDSAGNDVACE